MTAGFAALRGGISAFFAARAFFRNPTPALVQLTVSAVRRAGAQIAAENRA
jgi:hypothetical protein